ncbi:MAG: hypothetical protein ACI9MC_003462, partial [Kiritimatiellia bacterium]
VSVEAGPQGQDDQGHRRDPTTQGLIAGAVGLLAAAVRVPLLWDDAFAPGYDGWYYVLQVRSILDGQLLFDDWSVVHWFLAGLALLVGDVVVSNKIACLLFAGLTAAGGAIAAGRWTRSHWAAIAMGTWWAVSSLHLGVSSEYLKNQAGLVGLAWILALLPRVEQRRWTLGLLLTLVLLGPVVHKLTGVLGVAVVVGYAAMTWMQRRKSGRSWLWAAGAATALLVATGVFGLLRPQDLARFTSGVGGLPRFTAILGRTLSLPEQVEALLVHGVPVLICVGLLGVNGRPFRRLGVPLALMSVVLCAPGLPFDWHLSSWRLILMGFIGVGVVLALATARLGWPVAVVVVALGLIQLPWTVPSQAEREPDYAAWAPMLPIIQAQVAPNERVVAHRGLCGFVWAEGGRICENFQPQGDLDDWWRISWGMGEARLAPYSTEPPVALVPGYSLVREPAWQAFRADHVDRFSLLKDPRNPWKPRPAFVYGPGRSTPEPE